MKKNINEESTKTALTTEKEQKELKTRRKALKSILAASGVVVGSQALPRKWTRPLVESVVLPAHAQLSLAASFSSGIVVIKLDSAQPWYAKSNLLDSLISPAQASSGTEHGVRYSVCGTDETAGTTDGSFQIMMRIDGSNVDVCFSSLGAPSGVSQQCTQKGTTSIDGQYIANVNILMDSDDPGREEIVQLRNIIINDTFDKIKGTLNIVAAPGNDDSTICAGRFTCTQTTKAYSCKTGCTTTGITL